ncbi:MAG: NAD+ synthase [Chloroflexota bacterium]|nr:NAD+ synthase [Chloroflexota bacterium]MDE2840399.1 NAD+ synthase [Chloroflexota bacterium]MDE2931283.1 NAD+ synthase [Chloroflexota bacterium]
MKADTNTDLIARARTALDLNLPLTVEILYSFIRNEVHKFGFTRAVLNLSGGIDSALSAYLAAGALGAENVLALLLPYRESNPDSQADAETVVGSLGIPSKLMDITPLVDPYFAEFADMDVKRRGNVIARARMIVLYDQSVAFDSLPLGTSNKTELLLGYSTLHGDMASAVNPIGDLYKTQVRQLSRHLGIPEAIIEKPPSADLWPGQSDEGELGFAYEDVDHLLYLLVDERYRPEELIAAGFERQFVEDVTRVVQAMQYKRRPPIIAKLSQRTIERDFRYPRDWGR